MTRHERYAGSARDPLVRRLFHLNEAAAAVLAARTQWANLEMDLDEASAAECSVQRARLSTFLIDARGALALSRTD